MPTRSASGAPERSPTAPRTLRRQVGQLLIAGLAGPELSPIERAWWRLLQPAGVILFRRNIESAAQTSALLEAVRAISRDPLLCCVDVEGGLVDRLRDAMAPMPAAADVAATGDAALFEEHGRLIGREVRLFGFNVTLAPVLDLALPASAGVMRTRVASADPKHVTRWAAAFLRGLESSGVLGCGKHFPGLGAGTLDSHQSMPVIERDWDALWADDLAPYRALRKSLPMVMVAHAAYPRVTGDRVPASVSEHWIGEVLVRRVGFGGLIVSDDMEMGGILTQRSIEEAVVEAVTAGAHLVEVCRDPELVLRAFEALLSEAEHSPAFRRIVIRASGKVMRAKQKWLARITPQSQAQYGQGLPPTLDQAAQLRSEIVTFSERVASRRVEVRI